MESLEECHNSVIHNSMSSTPDSGLEHADEIFEFNDCAKTEDYLSGYEDLHNKTSEEHYVEDGELRNVCENQSAIIKIGDKKDAINGDQNVEVCSREESGLPKSKKSTKKAAKGDNDSKATFACEVCGRSFLYVSKLRYHERIHLNIRPHKCEICGRGFLDKSALKQHHTTHTKEKNFHCTICPKVFSSSSNLGTHVKRIHETDPDKIKKYTCEICFRVTSTAFNLRVHYQTHTGVKQFSCDVCHLFFAHKTSLNVHKKIHTGEISKKCEYCQKTFVSSSNYHRHIRMHRGEKPFSCSECSKVFADSSNLSKHKRIHTGEKLYACHVCDNLYTFSNHLSRHKKRCHPELQANFVKIVELPIEVDVDKHANKKKIKT